MYNIFNLSIDIQSMIYRNYKKSNHWKKTLKTINQVRSHYIWLFEATVTFCYVIVYYYIINYVIPGWSYNHVPRAASNVSTRYIFISYIPTTNSIREKKYPRDHFEMQVSDWYIIPNKNTSFYFFVNFVLPKLCEQSTSGIFEIRISRSGCFINTIPR